MKDRRTATKMFATSYQQASKKRKMEILEEFTQLTGYDRCYAAYLLRQHGKRVALKGGRILLSDATMKCVRERKKTYGAEGELSVRR